MEVTVHNLRELLIRIPEELKYDHRCVKQIRTTLRDVLFRAATMDGKYMDWLSDSGIPATDVKPDDWITHATSHSHYGRPCVRKLRRGEPTFRCLTCGLDETCVLCKYCFNEADHEGHNVFVKIGHRDDGGICDCGDHEAWKNHLHCKAEEGAAPTQDIPEELGFSLLETFEILLDFAIDVLCSAHCSVQFYNSAEEVYANERDAELDEEVYGVREEKSQRYVLSLWNDDRRSVQDAVLAIKVATARPHDFGCMVANEVDAHGRARLAVSADCNRLILQKSTIKLFTSTIRSERDFVREEMVDEIIHWLGDMAQARLRNSDPSLLTRLLGEALIRPWRIGNRLLRTAQGKAGPMMSGWFKTPEVALKPDYALPIWRHALLNGDKVPTVDTLEPVDIITPATEPTGHVSIPTMLYSELLSRAEQGCPLDFPWTERPIWRDIPATPVGSGADPRVKYLLFFDVRLWKTLRLVLCDLYLTSMVSNAEHKAKLGSIYADVYPVIAELYVMVDREPEVSIITSLSTQLFTTPSIATELSVGPHYSRYFAALFMLFVRQQVVAKGQPGDCELSVQSPIVRNRRLGQLFHEIEFLLNRNTNKAAVVGDIRRIEQAADFFSLFQSLTPMMRQMDTHVEYENETWVYFFTTMPFVHQLASAVASGALECTFEQVRPSIQRLAELLLRGSYYTLCRLLNSEASGRELFEEARSEYGGKHSLTYYNTLTIDRDPVSLHHPVQVFLSWLIEYSRVPTLEALQSLLFSYVPAMKADLGVQVPDDVLKALIFDGNLRAMGLLSQIHIGLWVRNGYAVRSQLMHYRETTLRDLAYSRDIFMAQVGLVSLDANLAFTQLMHRYNMISWKHQELFDEDQRYYMLEEFLHTLTFLLTDRLHLLGLDETTLKERMFEREIVQCLTFHAMSFSEMTKSIPESMLVCEDLFELVLKRCADFVPPKGVRDVGVYALKPEYIAKFDTHYTHFSQAKMDDAEHKIAEKISAQTGVPKAQVVHLPPLEPLSGPWAQLGKFTRCVLFAQFMYDLFLPFADGSPETSDDATKSARDAAAQDHSETVLGKALYLLLMAAQNDLVCVPDEESPGVFASVAAWAVVSPSQTNPLPFVGLLEKLLKEPKYHTLHPRILRLFELLHEMSPETVQKHVASADEVGESEAERKKRRGKEMRLKALEEFKKQQALFSMQASADMSESENESDPMEEDLVGWEYPTSQCVLCQLPDSEDSIFGIMTYITEARTGRTQPNDEFWLSAAYSGASTSLDVAQQPPAVGDQTPRWRAVQNSMLDSTVSAAFPREHSHISPVVTGCGHGVHFKCYQDHIQHQRQRPGLTRATPENVSKVEYLCTLCRGLNNSFMPVMWRPNRLSVRDYLTLPDLSVEREFVRVLAVETGSSEPGSMVNVITESFKELQPRFVEALAELQGFDFTFSHEVHAAVLVSIMRMSSITPKYAAGSDTNETLIHAYSATLEGMEIALRGVAHTNQLGGLLVDQLSHQSLQFLRVFTQFLRNMLGVSIKRQLDNGPKSSEFRKQYSLYAAFSGARTVVIPFRKFVESLFIAVPMFNLNPAVMLRIYISGSIWQFIRWIRTLPSVDGVAAPVDACSNMIELVSKFTTHNPRIVASMLCRHFTIALRRAALVIHGLCGVYNPDDFACMMDKPEYVRLSKYLELPELSSMLRELAQSSFSGLWDNVPLSMPFYGGVHELIRLPERLDMFFNNADKIKLPSDPAVCLFCGDVIDMQTYDRDRGPCNRHITQCMDVYGMFLQPKRNMLLYLLPDQRGSFTEAPYLDLHGEVDEHMRRGRPHYLQPLRYENLTRTIWLENGLASFVARKLDATTNQGGWETL